VHSQGYEIYTLYFGGSIDSGFYYTEPLNISNHPGYDNQPAFSPDNTHILFSSNRENNQMDIYKYAFANQALIRVTASPESEFSPEYSPDGRYITTVRIELDSSQRLWNYNLKRKKFKCIFKSIYGVGYYCRINPGWVALFRLPPPFTLQLAQIDEPGIRAIDNGIGRSIKMIPGENALAYISRKDSTFNLIKRYDLEFNKITAIKKIPADCEDMAWGGNGSLFMARGSRIYVLDYTRSMRWFLFADFGEFGITDIYRIAISPDQSRMAFVVEE